MSTLKDYVAKAAEAYYNGTPIISDAVFDALATLEEYNQVGARQGETTHLYKMYSLNKYYEDEGTPPISPDIDQCTTVKLDGASLELVYSDGVLLQAATRGDGAVGQDVTKLIMESNQAQIPLSISHKGLLQVTGEIVASIEQPNSRNYAAGALNLKDPKEFASRAITFVAHAVQPFLTKQYFLDMKALAAMGFNTVYDTPDLDKIFPTDGLVFRVNDNELFTQMGHTASHPRGAYARKVRGEAVETVIRAVEWDVGRTGRVTPVAILEPIYIGDKLVSRATLNNPGFIEALDIRIGDRVGVILGGEIIPCITHKVSA